MTESRGKIKNHDPRALSDFFSRNSRAPWILELTIVCPWVLFDIKVYFNIVEEDSQDGCRKQNQGKRFQKKQSKGTCQSLMETINLIIRTQPLPILCLLLCCPSFPVPSPSFLFEISLSFPFLLYQHCFVWFQLTESLCVWLTCLTRRSAC